MLRDFHFFHLLTQGGTVTLEDMVSHEDMSESSRHSLYRIFR